MSLKYYRYDDEFSPLGGGITYVETRDGIYALRQITVYQDQIHASNMRHLQYGLNLADQSLEYDKIDQIKSINKQEFDDVWQTHLDQHASEWVTAKRIYPVGSQVDGYIDVFYPQGVLVQLATDFWGLANYYECKKSTTPENMYSNHKLTATVSGYDEDNHWIILSSPRVFPERFEGEMLIDPNFKKTSG